MKILFTRKALIFQYLQIIIIMISRKREICEVSLSSFFYTLINKPIFSFNEHIHLWATVFLIQLKEEM